MLGTKHNTERLQRQPSALSLPHRCTVGSATTSNQCKGKEERMSEQGNERMNE